MLMPTAPVMRAASMFAGIGGFEVGFAQEGIATEVSVEIDKHCQTILGRHFTHPLLGDIADVRGIDLGPVTLDAFVGGFPCQDTSTAAPGRLGLAGKRSGQFVHFTRLLAEYQRLVDEHRPRFVVIENPDGLLASPGVGCGLDIPCGLSRKLCTAAGHGKSDRTGWDMAAVTRALEDLGYGWAYRVVDGQHLGSPQRRRRVLVVGHRGGDPRPAWAVLGDHDASDQLDRASGVSRAPIGPAPAGLPGGATVWRKSARARATLDKGGYETWVSDGQANTLTKNDAGLANRQTHLIAQHGRMRTLTLTEWERLQGFPDGWTEGVVDSARFDALGNAMHVGMAAWLGRRLAHVHTTLPLIGATS